MSVILIIVLLVILAVLASSLVLGRSAYRVESAKDTEYLELEGEWVRYNVIGGGPPVVLVHGWLSSSRVWDQLAHRLSQRFTVYTLDLPGFGESDKPLDGYGIRYGSRLLFAFCAHFGLTRVSVIGHDLGGDMVIKLASDHPDVVGRIALVSTPANEEQIDLPTPLWAATLPVVGSLFYALGRSVRGIRSSWMNAFVSESADVTDEMIDDAGKSTPAAMSKTLSVSKREISGGRLARQARMIRVPVLIITGEEDQIVDPQAAGVWSKSLEQSEVCLMDECGHMPMIERTGEFNAQILAFLTGDARYLEYAEQTQPRTTAADDHDAPDNDAPDAEKDTIEVGTLPPDGEDPAFGREQDEERETGASRGLFSPGGRRPRRTRRSPRAAEDSLAGGDSGLGREEDEASRAEDSSARRESDEPQDGGLTDTSGRDDLSDRQRFGGEAEVGEGRDPEHPNEVDPDPIPEGDAGEVRGFDEEPRRQSSRRRPRAWNFDEEPGEKTEEKPSPSPRMGSFWGGRGAGRTDDGEPSGEHLHTESEPRRDANEDERASGTDPYRGEGIERTPTGDGEAAEEVRPPERSARPSRRGNDRGDVPEVPEGLFDWGNSLDDFEPVDRSSLRRRRRRDSFDGEGIGGDGEDSGYGDEQPPRL